MGNQPSVPESFTEQSVNYDRLLRNVNQAKQIGNPDPATQTADAAMLKAASPKGFNLLEATNADNSVIEAKATQCRTYTGMQGLRDLRVAVGPNRTTLEAGCGWLTSPDRLINKSVLGSEGDPSLTGFPRGPLLGRAGQPDVVSGGATFTMDLEKAERNLSYSMVNSFATCASMSNADQSVSPYIGYCTKVLPTANGGRVIPIEIQNGQAQARFPNDVDFRCSGTIIRPSNTAACPTPAVEASRTLRVNQVQQGFKNPERAGSGYISHGERLANIHDAFSTPSWAHKNTDPRKIKEGFALGDTNTDTPFEVCRVKNGLTDANDASKECVKIAAQQAGFQASGALMKYLNNGTPSPVFAIYKQLLSGSTFDPATFHNGSNTVNDLVNMFALVKINMNHNNPEIAAAAKDIVTEGGFYENNYNLCQWFIDSGNSTVITAAMGNCLENYWRNNGGDSRGTHFPGITYYLGKTKGDLVADLTQVTGDVGSTNKENQVKGLARKYGIASSTYRVSGTLTPAPQDCVQVQNGDTSNTCPICYAPGTAKPKYKQKWAVTSQKLGGGANCPHQAEEDVDCPISICQNENCEGHWEYGPCSTTCGTGTRTATYVITKQKRDNGSQCQHTAGETKSESCSGTSCGSNNCVYTTQVTKACPTSPADPGCGTQQYTNTTYTIDTTRTPQAALSYCPNPNPRSDPCPIIQCAPAPPTPPATTANTRKIKYRFTTQPDWVGRSGDAVDMGTTSFSIHGAMRDVDGVDAVTWARDLSSYIAHGLNPQVTIFRTRDGNTRVLAPATASFFDRPTNYIEIQGSASQSQGFFQNDDIITLQYEAMTIPTLPSCEVWVYYATHYGTRPGYPAYTKLRVGDYDWNPKFVRIHTAGQYADRETDQAECTALNLIYQNGSCDVRNKVTLKPVDDRIMSIRVGSGVKAILYADPLFIGSFGTATEDIPNMTTWAANYTSNGISAIKVQANNQVAACIPPVPAAGCSSQRYKIGQVVLGSGYSKQDGKIVFERVGAAWGNVGGSVYLTKTTTGTDINDAINKYAAEKDVANIPNDRNIKPFATGWNDDYRSKYANQPIGGTAPTPYIKSKGTIQNERMTVYGGPTFCIILESGDGQSSATFSRVGKLYEYKFFIWRKEEIDEPWVRNWPRANQYRQVDSNRIWPMPQDTIEVSTGSPILGGTYNLYISIRSSDIPRAQSLGYEVVQ